tara:strand:- start:425 stop:559 length:135 start_codon:yes stop_codon:yes gene_type:complete
MLIQIPACVGMTMVEVKPSVFGAELQGGIPQQSYGMRIRATTRL